jgi:hypothetical protein
MRFFLETGISATVRTYAAPHPGDDDFASAYKQHIDSLRYEYADDIVPHLPPSLRFRAMFTDISFLQPYLHRFDLNYAAVGNLAYISKDHTINYDPPPTLRFDRYATLAGLLFAGRFTDIVQDHKSDCGGGYMTALCPTDVCP